jgi:hypothetical protein
MKFDFPHGRYPVWKAPQGRLEGVFERKITSRKMDVGCGIQGEGHTCNQTRNGLNAARTDHTNQEGIHLYPSTPNFSSRDSEVRRAGFTHG